MISGRLRLDLETIRFEITRIAPEGAKDESMFNRRQRGGLDGRPGYTVLRWETSSLFQE